MKKALTPFLLPPGIFVVLLVVAGMVLVLRRRWRVGLMNLALGMALWSLSCAPVASGLMRGLEAGFSIPTHPSGDVIILLGGGTVQWVPDLAGTAAPSMQMMGRVVAAARLYRRWGLPIIVTGGRATGNEVSEAEVAKRFLMDLGVPEPSVIEEDKARDTQENARFSAIICRKMGFRRPVLLTSAHHLKRACMAFDDEGMRVIPFPAAFYGSVGPTTTWRDLLPQYWNLYTSASALHEYLGIWYYRFVQ